MLERYLHAVPFRFMRIQGGTSSFSQLASLTICPNFGAAIVAYRELDDIRPLSSREQCSPNTLLASGRWIALGKNVAAVYEHVARLPPTPRRRFERLFKLTSAARTKISRRGTTSPGSAGRIGAPDRTDMWGFALRALPTSWLSSGANRATLVVFIENSNCRTSPNASHYYYLGDKGHYELEPSPRLQAVLGGLRALFASRL